MLKSYLTIALRNLRRHKGYSFINIAGLAIGMAACVLILLFVRHEFSYDRYHERADDIYRVYMDRTSGEEVIHWARTPAPLAPALADAFPEIRAAVRIRKNPRTDLVRYGDKEFYEDRFYFADSNVFDVFSFSLKQGNPETALRDPHAVVITEEVARKYFGDEDPVGKVLTFENTVDFTVTGILDDVPSASHFVFDFLASFESLKETLGAQRVANWAWVDHHTYVLLEPGSDAAVLESKLPGFLGSAVPERFASRTVLRLQPLTRIHLHSKLKDEITAISDATYSYILSTVALFILLIACINFMNLSTARSARRAREVGMRKVLGAHRGQLMRQFLGESMVFFLVSFLLSGALVYLLLPLFSDLAGKELSLSQDIGFTLAVFVGIALFVGLVAGSYPAFYLSAAEPVKVLKESLGAGRRGGLFRKVLVVFQFAVSIVLIIGTVVISNQLDFFRNTTLGFDAEQVIVIPLRDRAAMRDQMSSMKEALKQNPQVVAVSAASSTPGTESHMTFPFRAEGMDEGIQLPTFLIDVDFAETYDLQIIQGRDLTERLASDSTHALLINEQATRHFGFEDAVGKPIEGFGEPATIVGVVKDFQFQSLHRPVEPLVLAPFAFYRFLAIKIRPDRVPETLASIEAVWNQFAPERPFEYSFLDETIDEQYKAEAGLGRIFGYFSGLAVLIACLGLFGLASFTAERRTKEIGLRKVLGASTEKIVFLVSTDFIKLVVMAFVVAAPVAYLIMSWWLESFAHRVDVSLVTFVVAGVGAFIIAALTVSYQSIKAALTNPVETLRYE